MDQRPKGSDAGLTYKDCLVYFIYKISSNIYMQGKYKVDINGEVSRTYYPSSLWSSIVSNWDTIKSNTNVVNNRLVWKRDSIGLLAIKFAWEVIRKKGDHWDIVKYIWKPYIPPKNSIFF